MNFLYETDSVADIVQFICMLEKKIGKIKTLRLKRM
jgi:hypothetical protein